MNHFGLKPSDNIILLKPLSFSESLYLWKDAKAVLTDSGGLQEETTALGVPCLTIRENTERPITVEIGTNTLVGSDMEKVKKKCFRYPSRTIQERTNSRKMGWKGFRENCQNIGRYRKRLSFFPLFI